MRISDWSSDVCSSDLAAARGVVEGRFSAAATLAMAAAHGVEMPICVAVDAVVNQGAALDATIAGLLDRPFKAEGLFVVAAPPAGGQENDRPQDKRSEERRVGKECVSTV